MHLMIFFELNDHKIGKHYKWTLKMLKVVMVSPFTPHSMCTKVERFTAKTGCTSLQNGPSPSKYQGFRQKLICYKGISFFLNYFNSSLFVHWIWNISSHTQKCQPFLTSFSIFHAFNDFFALNTPEIKKHYKWTLKNLKLGMVW